MSIRIGTHLIQARFTQSCFFSRWFKRSLISQKGVVVFLIYHLCWWLSQNIQHCCFISGDFHQAKIWLDEESLWAERAVRLWDRSDHLQPCEQAVPVRQHWHGQGLAQVHGIQRAPREPDQCRHYRGEAKYVKAKILFSKCLSFYIHLLLCSFFLARQHALRKVLGPSRSQYFLD